MKFHSGHVAVVTGAASGIGYGLCQAFGRRGVSVVMADVDREGLNRAESELSAMGALTLAVETDVSQFDQVAQLADSTLDRFGRVDVICNNAGIAGWWAPMWEYDLKEWEWVASVNLWGVVHGIKAFVPHLVHQGSGHVVNTASMAGVCLFPHNGPYNAIKHAVVSVTETLAADLEERAPGVGATVLLCGPTRTRLFYEGYRWRPEHLRPAIEVGARKRFDIEPPDTLDAIEAAEITIAAAEARRLYVAPNPGAHARPLSRIEHLLTDLGR